VQFHIGAASGLKIGQSDRWRNDVNRLGLRPAEGGIAAQAQPGTDPSRYDVTQPIDAQRNEPRNRSTNNEALT